MEKSVLKQTETTLEAIEAIAEKLCREERSWHFHILTKDCIFNDGADFALILESSDSQECFVNYCLEKPTELGKRLVKLLHGEDVLQEVASGNAGEIQADGRRIITRAQELGHRGTLWHHHMLFPDCIFNEDKGKWTITLEDLERQEILKSVSNDEPKKVLREMERIFYQQ